MRGKIISYCGVEVEIDVFKGTSDDKTIVLARAAKIINDSPAIHEDDSWIKLLDETDINNEDK